MFFMAVNVIQYVPQFLQRWQWYSVFAAILPASTG